MDSRRCESPYAAVCPRITLPNGCDRAHTGRMTRMSRYLPAQHPLSRVYRSSAALFGIGLDVFGVLGFAYGLPYLDTHGVVVMGLSSNGTLSLISLVVGTVLVVAAVVGGALASTVMAVI